jgi:hypothetical protein
VAYLKVLPRHKLGSSNDGHYTSKSGQLCADQDSKQVPTKQTSKEIDSTYSASRDGYLYSESGCQGH